MPTTTVKTIGSGGDYSTIQAWEDAAAADLVAADEVWEGQLLEGFTGTANKLNVAGSTTDATRYKHLTTSTGVSFADTAQALRYNTSAGAYIAATGGNYYNLIYINENYFRLSKIQIGTSGTGSGVYSINGASGKTGIKIDRCIIKTTTGAFFLNLGATITNTLIQGNLRCDSACTLVNCTVIGQLQARYTTLTAKNVGVFNAGGVDFNNLAGATFTTTTCYSDYASSTKATVIAYDTTTGSGFENITASTEDWRIKSTSAMKDVGTTDATNAPSDIFGTARPQGAAYDVGAFEYGTATPIAALSGNHARRRRA